MKLLQVLAAAVAALGLAGVAAAQVTVEGQPYSVVPHQAFGPPPVQPLGSHWSNPELWDAYGDLDRPVGPNAPPLPSGLQTKMTQQVFDGLKVAVPQMRLACATDQQSLCADKTNHLAVDRCLEYHRLKLSSPCKAAWDQVTKAAEGRL
ncbi:hypothetical protein [Phenylobacterium sp.]|jgi:hypothetical protein|uniref:hypothetical protein n=1 Tax=Phenylobacterium sp. TaxID=1871053 RepID=UPI002F415EC1